MKIEDVPGMWDEMPPSKLTEFKINVFLIYLLKKIYKLDNLKFNIN